MVTSRLSERLKDLFIRVLMGGVDGNGPMHKRMTVRREKAPRASGSGWAEVVQQHAKQAER